MYLVIFYSCLLFIIFLVLSLLFLILYKIHYSYEFENGCMINNKKNKNKKSSYNYYGSPTLSINEAKKIIEKAKITITDVNDIITKSGLLDTDPTFKNIKSLINTLEQSIPPKISLTDIDIKISDITSNIDNVNIEKDKVKIDLYTKRQDEISRLKEYGKSEINSIISDKTLLNYQTSNLYQKANDLLSIANTIIPGTINNNVKKSENNIKIAYEDLEYINSKKENIKTNIDNINSQLSDNEINIEIEKLLKPIKNKNIDISDNIRKSKDNAISAINEISETLIINAKKEFKSYILSDNDVQYSLSNYYVAKGVFDKFNTNINLPETSFKREYIYYNKQFELSENKDELYKYYDVGYTHYMDVLKKYNKAEEIYNKYTAAINKETEIIEIENSISKKIEPNIKSTFDDIRNKKDSIKSTNKSLRCLYERVYIAYSNFLRKTEEYKISDECQNTEII